MIGGARKIAVLAFAMLTSVLACGPEWVEMRGVIETGSWEFHLELPDLFEVGVPADVTVWTYVGGCASQGPTRLTIEPSLVVIEPFDSVPAPGVSKNCPDALRIYQHAVVVEVSAPGDVTVRVRGLSGNTLVTRDATIAAQ